MKATSRSADIDRSELLRLSTAGSVDDGKSTLIGRLLHDTKNAFEDQLEHVERVSRRRGGERMDLSLLTDGLRAEREQGITIDVAYRYFSTDRRKFVIADTPGHVQYTRNMITGASTANLVILLVDARRGIVEQCRRHAFIASLLRIPHVVVAVNKMDLVGWDQDIFTRIDQEFRDLAARLDFKDIVVIPMCALHGDNVVSRSSAMPWYDGPTLVYHLENVHISSDRNLIDVRLPIQYVIRPQSSNDPDFRGYAGQMAGGVIRRGDKVLVLPSGVETTITAIEQGRNSIEEAFPPMSVTVRLASDLDVGRGDMICRPNNQPSVGQDLDAMICWMGNQGLDARGRYLLKHGTRTTRAYVKDVLYTLDVNTGHRVADSAMARNDLGRLRFRTTTPIIYDTYARNRATGAFILIDESSNETVAAGMLLAEQP